MAKMDQVAVVGMACRLPGGADDPESLWNMLAEGRDGRVEVPNDRWNWQSYYHPNADSKTTTNFSHGYYLDHDLSAFDARFFGVPGAEATGMDPQQRVLLEVVYEAIENGGISLESLRGSDTSVHMAMFARDYDRMGYRDGAQLHKNHIVGSGDAILANRISYLLDLRGSSNTLDTGCSGSLVALHQACRTLRDRESKIALAGASQLLLTPDQTLAMLQLTNPDGRCYTFDDRGAGYARGEGVGVLVLKRLEQALADGDRVHALVVESGCSHDGKTAGILLPNSDAQEALVRNIYERAGLDPLETLYVEAHGTGTQAGDNAEIASISKVFGYEAGRKSRLPVGSVKANIGHLEAASGIASMMKAIMVLKKKQIPPQLNFINPKPSLHLDERGIQVPLELLPLTPENHDGQVRISVNSFGYGGANAHAILEAYDNNASSYTHTNGHTVAPMNGHTPLTNGHTNDTIHDDETRQEQVPLTNGHVEATPNGVPQTNGVHGADSMVNGTARAVEPETKKQLVVLSASSEASLTNLIAKLRQYLKSGSANAKSFTDVVYTLNLRRSMLAWRCSAIASDFKDLERALGDSKLRPVKSAQDNGIAFVFTGQGAQWHAMGKELLHASPVYASSLAYLNRVVKKQGCEWDLVEELTRNDKSSRLSESRFSQPTTTAVQIALVDLLETLNIRPQAVCGHSSGEIAAAYAAGALNRDAAMQVAYHRGICSAQAKSLNTTQGAMLAVGEGEENVTKRIKALNLSLGQVTVACVNSPESTTVSGDLSAIEALSAVLNEDSVFNRRLKVDSAYHSHHMKVVAKSYLSSLDQIEYSTPRKDVAFCSSVTGTRKMSDFGPSYWVSNLVSQVKFSAALRSVAEHLVALDSTASNILLEVGPHSALSGPLRQCFAGRSSISGADFKYQYASCLQRKESALDTILALSGKLFESGCDVHLDAVIGLSLGVKSDKLHAQVVDNLPTYAWDHSTTYWHESRLSKGNRLRPFPHHELLGLFDAHSSLLEPRWRYLVSIDSIPWVKDHVVEDFVIFPGVGYLIMVIEAMKQLFQLRKVPGHVKNINFRSVNFAKPVVISEDGEKGNREVELQLVISPSRQYAADTWERFRVLSYDSRNDSWIENCNGYTSYDSVAENTPSSTSKEEVTQDDSLGHLTKADADKMLQDISSRCTSATDVSAFYSGIASSGIAYGPNFQGLKDIYVGKNSAYARIVTEDIAKQLPSEYMQPYTIHPTAFDSIIQLEGVAIRKECSTAPMMPVMYGEVSIAADMISTPGSDIFVALELFPESAREATANFCAYQKNSDGTFRPVVTGKEIRPQAIGDSDVQDSANQKQSFKTEWKLDSNNLSQTDFMELVSRHELFDTGNSRMSKQLAEEQLHLNDKVASIFIRRVVQRMQKEGISPTTPHLVKLLNWMIKWDQSEADKYLAGLTPQDEDLLVENASNANIVGLALCRLGPRYYDIFTGEAQVLELLIQDDLLGRLYSDYTFFMYHYAQMGLYMESAVHKNPNMKVLEIGAGTGGATMPLMEKIQVNDRLLLDSYTYTDISSGFFERAREKFNKYVNQMEFKTLDVSKDPLTQSFTPQSFDLIVASIVLHATPLMDVTIANVRKLLKPGGRLVLMELTEVAAAHNAIYGNLEGWWMSEDGRKDGPLLTLPEWDDVLKRHGFSGLDLAIPAHRGPSNTVTSVIVSHATGDVDTNGSLRLPESKSSTRKSAQIELGCSADPHQNYFAKDLSHSLSSQGITCSLDGWNVDHTGDDNSVTIIIDSAENALLLEPSKQNFERVKQVLLQRKNVIWLSFQSSSPSSQTAALKNMVNGLARVIRREEPSLRLVTVDIQDRIQADDTTTVANVMPKIIDIIASSFWPGSEAHPAEEREYMIENSGVLIPRIVPDRDFADYIGARSANQDNRNTSLVEAKYWDKERPLKFTVQVQGLLNTICFDDNEAMKEPLDADEIEMQVHAHGINFKDVFIALGQMAPGTAMTGEAAGVVTAVGSNIKSSWKIGDRVIGLMVAPFGSCVRVRSKGVVAIPESLQFADAASIPFVFYTAWYCLYHVARLEKGQSVLVHAASGGVGQAAIQLAKHVGAVVYATVGSSQKRKLIQDQYGVPDGNIFSSRTGSFKKQIMSLTKGKGVDVVLNSLSGQLLMDSWDCVSQFGTFLEIGKADIFRRSQLNMANFEKQATFAAVDTSHMYRLRPEFMVRGLREIYDMVDKGILRPVHPINTYSMNRIEEAFRLIAAGKHVGKLVLTADDNTVVQATRPKHQPLRLHKEGTYVIGGGFGDVGKKMAPFLAERGAGHIVALTRRQISADQRAPFEEAVESLGGKLHVVKCDISDKQSTLAAGKEISHLPPVRGVIQSALVLCDHPFEVMEVDDWMTALKPKVHGTINMKNAFCSPTTTDFFVMLSSIASMIGSNSQSNYAAGNAFQDALANAQNRSEQGVTRYAAINVGAVEGSEQIARALDQNSEIVRMIGSVSFDDVFATMEYTMGSQAKEHDARQCIMHFDRDAFEDALGPTALSDHIHDHVPSKKNQGEKSNNSSSNKNKGDVMQALNEVKSVMEAEQIVKQALLDKFLAFMGDMISDDQPISAIGMDSLVSIELKNWIKHTFSTPMQTSELFAAKNVVALAKLVVSRMDLKAKAGDENTMVAENASEKIAAGKSQMPEELTNGVQTDWSCCKRSGQLPAQPLPDLDDSLDFWLQQNEHLFTAQELEPIHQDIQSLRAPNSEARRIIEDLYSENSHDKSNGWFTEYVTKARFLSGRDSLAPYGSVMGGHRNTHKHHSQAERAAIITTASLAFKRAMETDEVEPLEIAGRPECTWRWSWLFNSTRIPQPKCDKMVSFATKDQEARDHIAVFRNGHLFSVMLQDMEGNDIPRHQLEGTFEDILAKDLEMIWSTMLTTDDRDSWAEARWNLTALNPANVEYFQAVDSALFVLCLDSGSPETAEEIAHDGYTGTGSNRWFDKELQFFVSANGKSGQITEHGEIDGFTPARLLEWIATALDEQSASPKNLLNGHQSPNSSMNELTLHTTREMDEHIEKLRRRFVDFSAQTSYLRDRIEVFGTEFLLKSSVPVKRVIDLTVQLALRLYFGKNVPSWEPMSISHFHTGRADALQRSAPTVNEFCDAAVQAYDEKNDPSSSRAKLAKLLTTATKEMNAGMQTMLEGRTFTRILEVVSYLWPEDATTPKPRFLEDFVFFCRPYPPVFVQCNALETELYVDDFVRPMPHPEGIWSFLVPEKNSIRVSITGGSNKRTEAFMQDLHRASRIMRDILEPAQADFNSRRAQSIK